MDIHINKKIAGIMIVTLIIGGIIGGGIGFAAGREEGHGGRGMQEMQAGGENIPSQYDNQADGEVKDDNGGLPNQDEQSTTAPASASTSVSVKVK